MEGKGSYEVELTCCGVAVRADAEAVQRVMTQHSLPAGEQAREWLRLSHAYADPGWMELCRQRARRMAEAVQEEREIMAMLGGSVDFASAEGGRKRPSGELAERHFEWLGARKRVPLEVVRDGITALARCGFIGDDADQQAALRRGLGIAVNGVERSSRAPWVRWMGTDDALNYLVDSLWKMELIYCSGGPRDKWKTLCGVFLRADDTCYETNIKGCRCRNETKRSTIDEAMLNGLRFVIS